ncbi:MAG: c-type cytochrome [Acidiferrobacter sp.]
MMRLSKMAAVCALVLGLAPLAAQAETRIQSDIGYRKDIMMAMDWNLVRIAQMARHQRPYNRARLASEGRALQALSTMPWVAFVPGSDRGFTKAEPRIWQQPRQFQNVIQRFESAAQRLAVATAQGNLAGIGRPLEQVAAGCHSCHHHIRK